MLSITRRSVFMQFCRTFVDDEFATAAPGEPDGDAPSERASFPSGEMNGLSGLIIICVGNARRSICDRILFLEFSTFN